MMPIGPLGRVFGRRIALVPTLLSLLWVTAFVSPAEDSVILVSGEELVGTIEEENAESVTIRYRVTGGIQERRRVPREDIRTIRKETPDDAAFRELEKLLPTADLLTLTDYQRLVAEPRKFLAEHPDSPHRAAAEAIAKSLEEEMARVREGRRKFEGNWLAADEYQRNEREIRAAVALRGLREKATAGDLLGALRAFAALEGQQDLGSTRVFPQAVELVRSEVLPAYTARLETMRKELPLRVKERAIPASLPPNERARAENALRLEETRWEALREKERSEKVTWRSVSPIHEKDIAEALQTAAKEKARLAKIDVAGLARAAELVVEGTTALNAGDYPTALAQFDRARSAGSKDPRLVALEREAKQLAEKEAQAKRETERQAAIAARAATQEDSPTPARPSRPTPSNRAADPGAPPDAAPAGENLDEPDERDPLLAVTGSKYLTFPFIVGALVGLIVLIVAFRAFQQYRFRKTAGSVIARDLSPSALNLDVQSGVKETEDYDDDFGGDRH